MRTHRVARRAATALGLAGLTLAVFAAGVRASIGDPVLVGQLHTGERPTIFETAAEGVTQYAGLVGRGGTCASGNEFSLAESANGIGVEACGGSIGLVAYTTNTANDPDAVPPGGVGVQAGTLSRDGIGVIGDAPFGTGVVGRAQSTGFAGGEFRGPTGVRAFSDHPDGYGVVAGGWEGTGVALSANGAVTFNSAGLSTIPRGRRSVTIDPGVLVDQDSIMLVTLQSWGGVLKTVIANRPAGTFTIWLTADATQAVTAAWFVIT